MDDAPKQVTDTPAAPRTYPPPSALEQWKSFIGELARPFAIIVTSLSASISGVVIAVNMVAKGSTFEGAAIFIGAVYFGVGSLYGAKSMENGFQAKQSASVEIARHAAGATP